MFSIVPQIAYEQKNAMRINNNLLRDTMDPFKIPDERYIFVYVLLIVILYFIHFYRFREMYRMPAALAQDFIQELLVADNELDKGSIPFHLQVYKLQTLLFCEKIVIGFI